MSLRFRRILYIIFIIAFLVIAPIVCLYAAGYKIASGFTIQKTGIFVVHTEPPGAKIYLNHKVQQRFFQQYFSKEKSYITTPAKIKNLLPGKYNIKITLEGYWPWQKNLAIGPGKTTFAENINLFKNNLPILIKNGDFNFISFSSDKKLLLLVSYDKITAFNTEDEREKSYTITGASSSVNFASTTNASWSPQNKMAIIGQFLFNSDNPKKSLRLDDLRPRNITYGEQNSKKNKLLNFKWDANNNNKFYYQSGQNLYSYNLNKNTAKILISGQIFDDYLIKDDYLYLINQAAQTILDIRSSDGKSLISSISLPTSSYIFLHPKNKYINLYDRKHKILYLINPFSRIKPLRETISNVNISHWIDENTLLYTNNFEIWLYDLSNWRKTLLTRISSRIKSIIWHPSNNYVIYATNNSINILELDDREKYNITKLIELKSIKWPHLNKGGNIIYFYAKIGRQQGLYKLIIQ